MLGGNDHNALGLIEHPRRFDFVEPDEEASEIEAGRDLIPYDALRAMLEQRLAPYLRWIAELAPIFAGQEVPPLLPAAGPVRRAHPAASRHLQEQDQPRRDPCPPIRAKLHSINSDIFRQQLRGPRDASSCRLPRTRSMPTAS